MKGTVKFTAIFLILTNLLILLSACSKDVDKTEDNQTKKTTTTTAIETTQPENPFCEVPALTNSGISLINFDFNDVNCTSEIASEFVLNFVPDIITADFPNQDNLAEFEGYTALWACSEETSGSVSAIYYSTDNYSIVKSNSFWLSGTPGEVSKHASAADYDICIYALFEDVNSGDRFSVFNTKLDTDPDARERQITYLYSRYACYIDYYPTVVTGNFNFTSDSENFTVITNGGRLDCAFEAENYSHIFTACFETEFSGVLSHDEYEYTPTFANLAFKETPYTLDLSKDLIALTFDDGPRSDDKDGTQYTSAVIEALEKYSQKATFFVVGERLKYTGCAEFLSQTFSLGYEIGNHTYDHTTYSSLSASELLLNLSKTDELVASLTGGMPTLLLRAPGGSSSTEADLDLPLINWSVDTQDWNSAGGIKPENVKETVLSKAKDGSIVLMHDLKLNSPSIIDEIVAELADKGFQMVTVSELFEFSDVTPDCEHIYYSVTSCKDR